MYNFVFVVLIYRNYSDLEEFLLSLDNIHGSYKVIVVNSFYDNETMIKIKQIAEENECDFINIENKGYGYGNNRGIEFAMRNYKFDYLIVSNPDIIVKKLDMKKLEKFGAKSIVGPTIISKRNRNQNPHYYRKYKSVFFLSRLFVKTKNNKILFLSIAVNKIYRWLSMFKASLQSNEKPIKVYAPHGSFILFSYQALEKIGTPFDERMFLFCEENHIAEVAKKYKIPCYYSSEFEVNHKEDGSMQYLKENDKKHVYNSLKVFHDNWG